MKKQFERLVLLIVIGFFVIQSFEWDIIDSDTARLIEKGKKIVGTGSFWFEEGLAYSKYPMQIPSFDSFSAIYYFGISSLGGLPTLHLLLHLIAFIGLFFFVRSIANPQKKMMLSLSIAFALPVLLSISTFSSNYLLIGLIAFIFAILFNRINGVVGIWYTIMPAIFVMGYNTSPSFVCMIPCLFVFTVTLYRQGLLIRKDRIILTLALLSAVLTPNGFNLILAFDFGVFQQDIHTIDGMSVFYALFEPHSFVIAKPVVWLFTSLYINYIFFSNKERLHIDRIMYVFFVTAMVITAFQLYYLFLMGLPLLFFMCRKLGSDSQENNYTLPISFYGVFPAVFWLATAKYVDLKPLNLGLGCDDRMKPMVSFIQQNKIQGPYYNNIAAAGVFIHYLMPEHYPFIYNNPQYFDQEFISKSYFPNIQERKLWHPLKSKFSFNAIVFDLKSASNEELLFLGERLDDGEWKLVFEEKGKHALLLRNNDINKNIIKSYSKF